LGRGVTFSLADKCARAAEGRAWHSAPQDGAAQEGGSGAAAQGGGKKKNKNRGRGRPQSGASVAAAAPGGQDAGRKRPRQQDGNSGSCPVHPNANHSASQCREIQKLTKRVSGRREQASKDGSPPRLRSGKERATDSEASAGDRELGYQSPNRELKGLFSQPNSDSDDDDERRKKLYVMYGGSWELVSR